MNLRDCYTSSVISVSKKNNKMNVANSNDTRQKKKHTCNYLQVSWRRYRNWIQWAQDRYSIRFNSNIWSYWIMWKMNGSFIVKFNFQFNGASIEGCMWLSRNWIPIECINKELNSTLITTRRQQQTFIIKVN